ncbi:MAG: hypothetical protein KQH57_15165 [Actinomycetales bacterium]|nr:hypothetical protein [Actinomycetales bacterium]
MGRHAAPGPPDRPTPERPEPVAPAPEAPAPQPAPSPAEPPASPASPIGFLASLALGVVVGLTAGGVLWWAGQPLAVAGAVAAGTALVVVLAAWVARGVAARHPLQ